MAAIYKLGTKWIVQGDAKYTLDAGSCVAVESADGTRVQLKLKDTLESILYAKYVLITDSEGTAYTKQQVLDLLDLFIPSTGNMMSASTGLGSQDLTVVEGQLAYSLNTDCDITKTPFVVYADGTTRTEPSEYTLSTELGIPTITFDTAPTVGNIPYILYTKTSIATQVEITLNDNIGVANGTVDAVLSDTVDLVHPGWICPRLLAGNIKFTDMEGNVDTWAFELKEFSPMRVKRVWLTGTTADMGIKVIY